MLNVIPGVVFLFRFGFDHREAIDGVDTDKLKEAFETILTTLGIGAKTNVGFGAMETLTNEEKKQFNDRNGKPVYYYCQQSKRETISTPISTTQTRPQAQYAQPKQVKPPECINHGCNNPAHCKFDGTYMKWCLSCIQKHKQKNEAKQHEKC